MLSAIEKAAKNAALVLLARCEYSRVQLTRKLQEKGYQGDVIDIALGFLQAQGYWCETRFINSMIRLRIARGMGPVKILFELNHKHQISKAQVVNSESWSQADWFSLVQMVYEKKYNDIKPKNSADKMSRWRFLQQRGFTHEQIHSVLI